MIITLGFTESDRTRDYSSFSDGYRLGAAQLSITVAVNVNVSVNGDGDGRQLTAAEWAQAAFVATNHPGPAPAGPARAIQSALAEQVHTPLRAISIGDTVTVHGQMWACESGGGWRRVDATIAPDPGDYVSAVRDAIDNGQTAIDRYLTTVCPECGQVGVPGDGDHRMIGPYVIVGCEGYYVVNPNLVGVHAPNWQPAPAGDSSGWMDSLRNAGEHDAR